MAKYSASSPYFATPQNKISLDIFNPRSITAEADDQTYKIENKRYEDLKYEDILDVYERFNFSLC